MVEFSFLDYRNSWSILGVEIWTSQHLFNVREQGRSIPATWGGDCSLGEGSGGRGWGRGGIVQGVYGETDPPCLGGSQVVLEGRRVC